MYKAYFNLQEKPFKLVPNPEYLYLSKSHEIALAHLNYAIEQGDGFVVVTGEVGTGKTTLCRMFLDKLEARTESAYIFNPSLDSVELLASICKEFDIHSQETSIKALLDILNDYLILRNKMGRKVILLIDEAQNLTVPSLEMVRMLSNLETTRQKLLQIILVGQPELSDKLDTYELRQLAQRISLGCYLTPLSVRETEKYIQHRLAIAAQRPLDIFTTGACREIHRYTGGIPRLINIAADRAMLTAFSLNRTKISRGIAQTAIKEIRQRRLGVSVAVKWPKLVWGAIAFLAFAVVGVWVANRPWFKDFLFHSGQEGTPVMTAPRDSGEAASFKIMPSPSSVPQPHEDERQAMASPERLVADDTPTLDVSGDASLSDAAPVEASSQAVASAERLPDVLSFEDRIVRLNPLRSREEAFGAILARWTLPPAKPGQVPSVKDTRSYFDISARQYGLRVQMIENDWSLVERLNMPAILALSHNEAAQTVFMTLVGRQADRLLLSERPGGDIFEMDMQTVARYFKGPIYVFWKNIFGFDAVISSGSHEAAIQALKAILEKIGYGILDTPGFDESTRAAVLAFQKRNGIEVDGLVGPVTKMMLILAAGTYNVPCLDQRLETDPL